jgi:hypothetical protein
MSEPGMSVRIDRIALEIGEERRAQEAEEVVRRALALLGARLARAPLRLGDRAPELVLGRLEVGPLDPTWIGSAAAAGWLADDLYRQLLDVSRGGGDGR